MTLRSATHFCTGCAFLVLLVSTSARAEPLASDNASVHFQEGLRHLSTNEPNRYQRAYSEFRAAYASSRSWKVLGNLGILANELERDGEAMDAMAGYLAEAHTAIDSEERRQFEQDLAILHAEHVTVNLLLPAGPVWLVDKRLPNVGTTVVNRYGPFEKSAQLRLRAGHHILEVAGSGQSRETWEVDLSAGSTAGHTFVQYTVEPPSSSSLETVEANALTPATTRPSVSESAAPPPVAAPMGGHALAVDRRWQTETYALWGVAGVGALAGVVLLLQSQKIEDGARFYANCPESNYDAENPYCSGTKAEFERAATWKTASAVSGITGSLALLSGTVLYLLDNRVSSDTGHTELELAFWFSGERLGLTGSF